MQDLNERIAQFENMAQADPDNDSPVLEGLEHEICPIHAEAHALDSASHPGSGIGALLQRWQVRGCQVQERLSFIKQPTALQPILGSSLPESIGRSEPTLKRKQRAAQEALGRAALRLHQTLEQHALLQRVSKVVPYALMGLAGLLTIVAGVYFGQRLLESPAERRQQTIRHP